MTEINKTQPLKTIVVPRSNKKITAFMRKFMARYPNLDHTVGDDGMYTDETTVLLFEAFSQGSMSTTKVMKAGWILGCLVNGKLQFSDKPFLYNDVGATKNAIKRLNKQHPDKVFQFAVTEQEALRLSLHTGKEFGKIEVVQVANQPKQKDPE